MNNTGQWIAMAAIMMAFAAAFIAFLAISLTPRVSDEWHSRQPTPIPTHTPAPTHTPPPTPHDTPAPDADYFAVAVSLGSTLTAADISSARYATTVRQMVLPHCSSAVAQAHPREYFHILLQPSTLRLRELMLPGSGFNQLPSWSGAGYTLNVDSKEIVSYVYTTRIAYPCGDSVRDGLGGKTVTFTLGGH